MLPLVFEPAGPKSFETVRDLVQGYFAYDGLVYTERVEAALGTLLDDPGLGRVVLARLEDEVVGYGVLAFGFDHEAGGRLGVVTDLFLVERARGGGRGRALLEHLVDLARAERLVRVDLVVLKGNDRARALYASQGFVPVEGRTPMTRGLEDGRDYNVPDATAHGPV